MDAIELQEWEKMEEMGSHAIRYMEEGEGQKRRDNCVEDLLSSAQSGRNRRAQEGRIPPVRRW